MATTDVSGTWNLDYNNYYACGDQVLSCTTEDFQCGCSLHKLSAKEPVISMGP